MNRLSSRLLVVLLAALAVASPALAQAPGADLRPRIFATGTARVERDPEYVDIVVGIEAQDKTASVAQEQARRIMAATIEAIRKLSLADEDLKSGTIELSPRYGHVSHSGSKSGDEDPMRIVGYTASMNLRVRTSDLTAPAKVIDAALASGANRIGSVSFGIKDAIEAREEAIALATKAAMRKGEVIATALGVTLGKVIEASASDAQPWAMDNRAMNYAKVEGGSGGGDIVVPGKIEIRADVNVTFTIAP